MENIEEESLTLGSCRDVLLACWCWSRDFKSQLCYQGLIAMVVMPRAFLALASVQTLNPGAWVRLGFGVGYRVLKGLLIGAMLGVHM